MSEKTNKSWLQRHRRTLLFGGPLIFVLVAAYIYITGGRYIATDDAYVQSARADISSNIAGRVVEIPVQDNQPVARGDILFKLDDRDLALAIQDAKANLENEKLKISALKATYLQQQANVKSATDTLTYRTSEFERHKKLAAQGISSRAQLDEARHAMEVAQQQVASAEQQRENVRAALGDNPDLDVKDHPAVQKAQAALDQAELNLSYATIKAPTDGIVSKVEGLQVGDYIKGATPVFALVSNKDIWLEANYKETELTHMRPGQMATIEIDTYPGTVFHGKIESLSPGTGSSYSLLPPENATGNWVKVVQRLPVRVTIDDADPQKPLHAGLSAIVKVDTGADRFERHMAAHAQSSEK